MTPATPVEGRPGLASAAGSAAPTQGEHSSILRVWRNAGLYTLANGLQRGSTVLIMPLLLSRLSVADYGRYGLLLSIYALLPNFLGLALNGAISRFYFDSKDEVERRRIIGALLTFDAVFIVFATLVLDRFLGRFVLSMDSLPYRPYLQITLWASAAVAINEAVLAFWRAAELPIWVGAAQLITFGSSIGSISYFMLVKQLGLTSVPLGLLIGQGSVGLVILTIAIRQTEPNWNAGLYLNALKYSLPLLPHLSIAWVLRASDRWIVEHFCGSERLGVYFFSYQIASVLSLVMYSANDAIVPRFLSAYRDQGRPGAQRYHSRIFPLYLWTGTVLAVAIITLSPALVAVLPRGRVLQDPLLAAILTGAMLLSAVYIPFANGLFALKSTLKLTLMTVGCGVLEIGLNLSLVPRLGIHGAALSMLLAYACLLVLVHAIAVRRLGLAAHWGHLWGAVAVLAVVSLIACR